MSTIESSSITVYGHFSQPPRGHPLTGEIGTEPTAIPFNNWNERVTAHCYRPNSEADNYRHMSFSFSEYLLRWLQTHTPDVYENIIASDQPQTLKDGTVTGNALATAYHHTILPLARRRDKRTQIRWGIMAFEHHFKRKPLGFWLPEMAVDTETLILLAEAGIGYVVLATQQIRNHPHHGAGPYRIALPNNRSITVFTRDDYLSSEISFNIHNLGGAGHWARLALAPARKSSGGLLLMATEGETFGHHHAGEDQFLHWLITHEATAVGYTVTTLDHVYATTAPRDTVAIIEPSSWSDQSGLANWATGHLTPHKDTTWKGALRRALDNAASEIDRTYEDLLRPLAADPWELRNRYVSVLLDEISAEDFLAELLPDAHKDALKTIADLLTAEELSQRMYNSYTFTDDDLDSRQPRYAIAAATLALQIAQTTTPRDLMDRFQSDLMVITGNNITGIDILHDAISHYRLDNDNVQAG